MAEATEQLSKRVEDAMKLTEGMTAIELASYSKAMRDKFGITAAPVAVAGVAAPGGSKTPGVHTPGSPGILETDRPVLVPCLVP